MARPLRLEYPGAIYHVTARGDRRESIYEDDNDRLQWLDILSRACERYNWQVHAYCLMDNHYHVLLETAEGNLSKGMRHLNGVYTQYFNRQHNRVGHVFQGRFKATHANEDNYLKYLFSYIHLNPVKLIDSNWKENSINDRKKAERYLETYTYSSYIDYIGHKREEGRILNTKSFPDYFKKPNTFKEYVRDWISFSSDS